MSGEVVARRGFINARNKDKVVTPGAETNTRVSRLIQNPQRPRHSDAATRLRFVDFQPEFGTESELGGQISTFDIPSFEFLAVW